MKVSGMGESGLVKVHKWDGCGGDMMEVRRQKMKEGEMKEVGLGFMFQVLLSNSTHRGEDMLSLVVLAN